MAATLLLGLIRNGDEITFPSKRIDLGQICSISNYKKGKIRVRRTLGYVVEDFDR
jgi:hypothetical protein